MHIEELSIIAERLEQAEVPIHAHFAKNALSRVEKSVRRAESAWSGSWLGYHARVYYSELNEPPPDAKFSRAWGLLTGEAVEGPVSTGNWCKYRPEDVIKTIWQNAQSPNLLTVRQAAQVATKVFNSAKEELRPLISDILARHAKQDILNGLATKIEDLTLFKEEDFLQKWQPKSLPPSHDEIAIAEGKKIPPHLQVKAEIWAIRHPFMLCGELAKTIRWLANLLQGQAKQDEPVVSPVAETAPAEFVAAVPVISAPTSTTPIAKVSPAKPKPLAVSAVPISLAAAATIPVPVILDVPEAVPVAPIQGVCLGHGRSTAWKELRSQLLSEANVACEPFNHLPVAGLANVERLTALMRNARFVILVHTHEDEGESGPPIAAWNVAHVAGIFQGHIGFSKVVVLVEDGREELTLIGGLPRIRFPKGQIRQALVELRTLLEQEDILPS